MAMYCRGCGQRLDKDALFCFHCGAKQEEAAETPAAAMEEVRESPRKFCQQCGAALEEDAAFCLMCGAKQEAAEAIPAPVTAQTEAEETEAAAQPPAAGTEPPREERASAEAAPPETIAPVTEEAGAAVYCQQCGAALEEGAAFCLMCGAKQEAAEAIPAPVTAQTEAEETEAAAQPPAAGTEPLREERASAETAPSEAAAPAAEEEAQAAAYCIQCGAALEEGAAFCLMCGAKQEAAEAMPAPVTARARTEVQAEAQTGAEKAPARKPAREAAPIRTKKKKKRSGFALLALTLFLFAAAAAALLVLRPWEAWEPAAAESAGAPMVESIPEENPDTPGAPEAVQTPETAQTTETAQTPEAAQTPGAADGIDMMTAAERSPDAAIAPVSSADAPSPAAFAAVPITEGEYALLNPEGGLHLGVDTAGDRMCMSGLWTVRGDRSFRIRLADGDFNNGYHIIGPFGALRHSPGTPPSVYGFSAGQEDARWQFSAAGNGMYCIHLLQAPGYALAHEGEGVFLSAFDAADPRQHWLLADPDAAVPQGEAAEAAETARTEETGGADELGQYIYGLASRRMDISELYGMDEETAGYIRNGIYALAGKIFKTEKYQRYFGAQSWYTPYSDNNDLITARFNEAMEHNLNVCIEYEKRMGWR